MKNFCSSTLSSKNNWICLSASSQCSEIIIFNRFFTWTNIFGYLKIEEQEFILFWLYFDFLQTVYCTLFGSGESLWVFWGNQPFDWFICKRIWYYIQKICNLDPSKSLKVNKKSLKLQKLHFYFTISAHYLIQFNLCTFYLLIDPISKVLYSGVNSWDVCACTTNSVWYYANLVVVHNFVVKYRSPVDEKCKFSIDFHILNCLELDRAFELTLRVLQNHLDLEWEENFDYNFHEFVINKSY